MIAIGDRFGQLTVTGKASKSGLWRCLCDCGKKCVVRGSNLRAVAHGRGTKSCGHLGKGQKPWQRNYAQRCPPSG